LLAILTTLVLAAAILVIALAAGGAQAQVPTITVDLEDADKDQMAFPTETENDILTFEGCLTLNRPIWPPGTSVSITLSIEISDVDEPWDYIFDPPSHTFTASETQRFSVRVTVPARLPATVDIGPLLEFTASNGGIIFVDITPDTARVTIAQYYKITRYYSTEPVKVVQGEIVEFNFTVQNRGNGIDTFVFTISNEAELLFAGLTLSTPSPKRIAAGGEANGKIQMQAASDALVGQFHANITIKSEGSSQDPNIEQPVTNSIEWNVVIEPSLQSTLVDNIPYIIIGVVALIVVIAVLVFLRKRRRAREEAEALEEEAKARRSKKKRKKRPKDDPGEKSDDDGDVED